MLTKIEGWIFAPQLLLYALAYRVLGKQYTYTPGARSLRPLGTQTPRERAFVLLFPLLALGSVGLMLTAVWAITFLGAEFKADPLTYVQIAPFWHQCLWWVGLLLVSYASLSIYKVPFALKLLFHKQRQQPPQNSDKYQNNRNPQQQRSH